MNIIPRQKLRYIIAQYGRDVCDEPKRCEAFLRDLCPEYKREINVLIGAMNQRVATDLMSASNTIPKEILFTNLTQRLYDNLGMTEEFAQWAVDSWKLGIETLKEFEDYKKKLKFHESCAENARKKIKKTRDTFYESYAEDAKNAKARLDSLKDDFKKAEAEKKEALSEQEKIKTKYNEGVEALLKTSGIFSGIYECAKTYVQVFTKHKQQKIKTRGGKPILNPTPRQKLQYIITQYGSTVYDEPKRCEALLRDLCPEYKREINVLIIALKGKVAVDLMTTPNTISKKIQLAKRLYDNFGIKKEFAQWSVDSWALALSVISGGKSASQTHKAKITIPREKISNIRTSEPLTVSDEEAEKILKLKSNRRPQQFIKNDYNDNGDGTITDHATGLIWQKSGSDTCIPYERAQAYIQRLNSERFVGYSDWRLPTTGELMSLLEEKKQSNDLYINPMFNKIQLWCWSSDKRSSSSAWGVSFFNCNVCWLDLRSNYYVRAVHSKTS
ncbi:MAG: DUF1566 domain-containing protein [Desulfobacterales bacterium]|nr:DUF1566 domain-containing protein [Desulfobacterales bacterium]